MRLALGMAMAAGLATSALAEDEKTAPPSDPEVPALRQQLQDLSLRLDRLEKKDDATTPVDDSTFRVYWDNGLRLETTDDSFAIKMGGRAYVDFGWISEDLDLKRVHGDQLDYAEFRMARLYVSGTIYDTFIFKAEYNFAGGDAVFMYVYAGVKDLPYVGTFKIGHDKEPFSLEELTSSRFVTFMERSLPHALVPHRNTGAELFNTALDENLTWAIGVFKDSDNYGEGFGEGEWAVTGRITGTPWFENEGEVVLHTGLSLSYRSPTDDTVQYDSQPECHGADYFIDTGDVEADAVLLVGPELALVYGPFSVQAEYVLSKLDSKPADDPFFYGYYVQGSYFLTGEHRTYKQSKGAFNRVTPAENFSLVTGGLGAVELTARYSNLDLNSKAIDGGELNDITAGVNWYPNPNMRIMMNYIHSRMIDYGAAESEGRANILMMRIQVDF